MTERFEHFLQPLTIRGKTWRNRLVAAPMGLLETKDGRLTAHAKEFIDFYAQGDVAEYIVGETDINEEGSRMPGGAYKDIRSKEMRYCLKKCALRIHSHGCLAMLELCHCGATKMAGPASRILGPMDYIREADGAHVEAMTEEDIARTVADFASAAVVLKEAGFDGTVIHAGHEWLPHQFLSPRTNQRTDRFGGSIENRCRFLIMVMDAIRSSCGEEFIIECRLSGSEHREDGCSMEEMVRSCQLFSEHCDIIHVSSGLYYDPVETYMMSTCYEPHGCNLPVAAEIKKHVNIPVAVVGGFNDPELCEKALAEGQADLIIMGRQRLADPLFLTKCKERREDEIRRCIRCTRCFPGPMEHVLKDLAASGKGMDDVLEQLTHCTVNPEFKYGPADQKPLPKKKKKVLVVGGGCAGMQTAITAAKRGHKVTLVEKSEKLGGILNFAKDDPIKRDMALLVPSMEAELKRLGVAIHRNTEFSEELLREGKFEAVIAALGSRGTTKQVPGMDGVHVISVMDAYQPDMRFGNHAVVVGGGQSGCEAAIHIAQTGCKVTLVVKHETPCEDAYRLYGIKLRKLLEESGCEVLTKTRCVRVDSGGVTLARGEEYFREEADAVVNALGMESVPYQSLEDTCEGLEFYAVGDCVKARTICEALEEAHQAALKL